MSKLAHSNESTMTRIEIKNDYAEMSEDEFFEHICMNDVSVEDLEAAIGGGIVNEYMQWIYFNIK